MYESVRFNSTLLQRFNLWRDGLGFAVAEPALIVDCIVPSDEPHCALICAAGELDDANTLAKSREGYCLKLFIWSGPTFLVALCTILPMVRGLVRGVGLAVLLVVMQRLAAEALPVLLYILAVIVLTFSAATFAVACSMRDHRSALLLGIICCDLGTCGAKLC
eukprot:6486739-Amphidinium_carterae.1